LIFTISKAASPDEPPSPAFIASLDAVTAVLTYLLAALGVVVMMGMSDRVKAMKEGVAEHQLPPATGLAACVSRIGYFKYVLAEANKMESTMKISDSWSETAAQTDERNECGRKVVNVTEHNVEDASCDTSDLAAPLPPPPKTGSTTTDAPRAPPESEQDVKQRQRDDESVDAVGGLSEEAGPLELEGLQVDERLVAWQPAADADATASTNQTGAAPTPAAARASLSSGNRGVEMQQLHLSSACEYVPAGGAAGLEKVGADSGVLGALWKETGGEVQRLNGDLVLATMRPL